MPYKTCPACRQISYSSADNRIWFCPCCGEDISAIASVYDNRRLTGLGERKKGVLYDLTKRRTV